jgi:DNA polymerase I
VVLTVDHRDGGVDCWHLTADGVRCDRDPDYRPTLYVGDAVDDLYGRRGGAAPDLPPREGLSPALADLRAALAERRRVVDTAVERRRQTVRTAPRPLLRVDVADVASVSTVARYVRRYREPAAYTCYDVDLDPAFRYCLETGTDPSPATDARGLGRLHLSFPAHESSIDALPQLRVDGDCPGSSPREVAAAVARRVADTDPDVLVADTARVVPLLFEAAEAYGLEPYALGRRPGYRQLAAASTYTSYGTVHHSPARYGVPGRVVLDRSNSFFHDEAGLAGCLDLAERSGLPLQELGRASIGRVLTAMQIRALRERDVVVPWRAWRPELFERASVLDDADRGGTTLAPAVGVHEDVHELDFASLYPNVIRTRNVSPETVCCGCCDSGDVPGLGYAVCDRPGYLPDVLGPLIDDRAAMKRRLAATDDPGERARLEASVDALKWVLVACFGYQGFSNAKFGRIECHEAINAYAREILLDAKATLEDGGWRVLHGIVDSVWVTPREDCEQTPLADLAAAISDDVGVELEYEGSFEWVAFLPRRDSEAGALTRYLGRRADEPMPESGGLGEAVKVRGVELRQRSTPEWVRAVQRDAVRTFDRTRSPEAVCSVLARRLATLEAGGVAPEDLLVSERVSKAADDYRHETLAVAALRRADARDAGVEPGQTVTYLITDADASGPHRVRLAFEPLGEYDAAWYRDAAVRAVESVVSAVGWRRDDVRAFLADESDARLDAFE